MMPMPWLWVLSRYHHAATSKVKKNLFDFINQVLWDMYKRYYSVEIFEAHPLQMFFPLNSLISSVLLQNIHDDSNFFSIIESPSTKISSGSFSEIWWILLISIGITTLPNSSTLLTTPVDFNLYLLNLINKLSNKHRISYQCRNKMSTIIILY